MVLAIRYETTTHDARSISPRLEAIAGSAVATMVWSATARNIGSMIEGNTLRKSDDVDGVSASDAAGKPTGCGADSTRGLFSFESLIVGNCSWRAIDVRKTKVPNHIPVKTAASGRLSGDGNARQDKPHRSL